MSKNLHEKPKNLGYQERKFQISLANTPHLRFPRAFLDAIHIFTAPEFRALVKLWDWFQSPEVRHHEQFTIGRAKLAQLAGVGERQAGECLKKLERLGFILARPVTDGRRVASTYLWNWGNIVGTLYPRGTTVVPERYNQLSPRGTTVVPDGYNLYITSLLVLLNPSYSMRFGGSLIGEMSPGGDLKDALRAGLPENDKMTALVAAVRHCWHRTAPRGGWPLHDLHDAFYALMDDGVDILTKTDLKAYLFTVLKDGEALYLFRKKNSHHFKNEAELLANLDQINHAVKAGGNENGNHATTN